MLFRPESHLRKPITSLLLLCLPFFSMAETPDTHPLKVKVVIVALFELGDITGDRPGEFQLWAERYPLPERIPLPHGNSDLYWNPEDGVLGMVAGIGTAKTAASITAVALDPRFDISKAYWLLAGIAGFDPEDASLASVCWIDWVVDGDLSHSIDIREAPDGWPTGRFPFRAKEPYAQPRPESEGSVFHLNEGLDGWRGLLRGLRNGGQRNDDCHGLPASGGHCRSRPRSHAAGSEQLHDAMARRDRH